MNPAPYIVGCVLIVLLAIAGGIGHRLGSAKGRIALSEYKAKVSADHLAELADADKRTSEAESKLAAALAKHPQTGKKVADAVRDNPAPADCAVPDAVVDSLQDGIDSGRSATR